MSRPTSRSLTVAGHRVHFIRESRDLGLRELAKMSGVSAAMISRFERGNGDATISTVDRLRIALGLTWDQLMNAECEHEYVCRFCGEAPGTV